MKSAVTKVRYPAVRVGVPLRLFRARTGRRGASIRHNHLFYVGPARTGPATFGSVVHPLSIRSVGLPLTAGSNPDCLRRPRLTTYRCSLPGLTGFAASRRAGPGDQRHFSGAVPTAPRPRAGIRPRYSGLRVQGTASSPSSTTASHAITAAEGLVKANLAASIRGCGRTCKNLVAHRWQRLPPVAAKRARASPVSISWPALTCFSALALLVIGA